MNASGKGIAIVLYHLISGAIDALLLFTIKSIASLGTLVVLAFCYGVALGTIVRWWAIAHLTLVAAAIVILGEFGVRPFYSRDVDPLFIYSLVALGPAAVGASGVSLVHLFLHRRKCAPEK